MSIFLEDLPVLQARAEKGLPLTTRSLTELPGAGLQLSRTTVKPEMLSSSMRADLQRMQTLLGADVQIERVSRVVEGGAVQGSQLQMKFVRSKKLPGRVIELNIPEALPDQPGVLVRGATQQSKYIAGEYAIVSEGMMIGPSFKHEEWVMRRATEDLTMDLLNEKRLSQRRVNHMVSQFERTMMEAPEWVPTYAMGEHMGADEYIDLQRQSLRLRTPTGEVISEFEYARIMEQKGLWYEGGGIKSVYPSSSPAKIAGGVVSTIDTRGLMSAIPESVDWARRPLQPVRMGVTPSPEALAAIEANPINRMFSPFAATRGVPAPMEKVMYISDRYAPELEGTGITPEGAGIRTSRRAAERGVRRYAQFNIARDETMDLFGILEGSEGAAGEWTINKKAAAGTFLGYSPEGRPVVLEEDMFLSRATAFEADRAKGDFVRVMALRDITDTRYGKVFGGGKQMLTTTSQQYAINIGRGNLGLPRRMLEDIDTIITMGELKKNRNLHYNQMFSSLWEYTTANMTEGKHMATLATNFVGDPWKIMAQMQRSAMLQDKFSHEVMLGQIHGLAKAARLSPAEMGRVFGAVPDIFPQGIEAMGALAPAEREAISKGIVTGWSQFFFEDVGGPGSGRMATIEPRMFEMLNQPGFKLGGVGAMLQADIAHRMTAMYPERLLEERLLVESLRSLTDFGKLPNAVTAEEVLGGLQKNILPATATNVRIGGIGDIAIPGAQAVSQLAEFRTSTGDIVASDLAHAYRGVLESAKAYGAGDITKDVMLEDLASLRNEVAQARSLAITGEGGILRGRLPGSMFLTAVPPTAGTPLKPGVVGITAPYASRMFGTLEQVYGQETEALASMRQRFFAGETVGGVLARHPFIGPYGALPVQFQLVPGREAVAQVNERFVRATAAPGRVGAEAVRKLAAQGATEGLTLRLSPMVGLAGDFDADIVAAIFGGPQLEQTLSTYAADQSAMDLYEAYSIRSQVLKAKPPAGTITQAKGMAAAATKLGLTEGGRLGKLSMALQRGRAAVLGGFGGAGGMESLNALGLLEWLEQVPISGKHVRAGSEQQLLTLLEDIQESIYRKDANRLAQTTKGVLAHATGVGQAALREGITIATEDIASGEIVHRHIPGLDISKSAKTVANAIRNYEQAQVPGVSEARFRDLMLGRNKPRDYAEAKALQNIEGLRRSPFGLFMSAPKPGPMAAVTQRLSAIRNKMGAAGRSMLEHARPLALGAGVALGLAAMLSEPPRMLQPGAKVAPTPSLRSGTGGANVGLNVHPEQMMSGRPTVSSDPSAHNTARLAGPPSAAPGFQINISGVSPGSVDYRSLSSQIRQAIGGNAQINSIIRDDRSSLTPQKVSDILRNT
jgi:hypothetical protein